MCKLEIKPHHSFNMSTSRLEKSLDEIIAENGPPNRSRPRRPRPEKSLHRRSHPHPHRDTLSSVQVANLSDDISEQELSDLFEKIGPVLFVKMDYTTSGRSTGVAYVKYENSHDARDAVDFFDGKKAAGEVINVRLAPVPSRRYQGNRGSDIPTKPRNSTTNHTSSRRPPKKTSEELDAELDAYMKGTN